MSLTIYRLARGMAWVGAIVLTMLAALSVISITGRSLRALGLGAVPGDFELVEVFTALAVFCFMPWCHLKCGHAIVDILWSFYPSALKRGLIVLTDALMFIVWVVLVWRMGIMTFEYRDNGEVSFILLMPTWWGYAASMVPAAIGCFAYFWRLLESLGLAAPPQAFATTTGAH